MTNEDVQAIINNPHIDPYDLIRRILRTPEALDDWLREKRKAWVGNSNDCQDCVIANFVKEILTANKIYFEYVEVTQEDIEIGFEDRTWMEIPIRVSWFSRFVTAIDSHQYCENDFEVNAWGTPKSKSKIFSGNLAANILKVTLASGVE